MKKRLLTLQNLKELQKKVHEMLNADEDELSQGQKTDQKESVSQQQNSISSIQQKDEKSNENFEENSIQELDVQIFKNIMPQEVKKKNKQPLIALKNLVLSEARLTGFANSQNTLNRSQVNSLYKYTCQSGEESSIQQENAQQKSCLSEYSMSRQNNQQEINWQSEQQSKIKAIEVATSDSPKHNIERKIKKRLQRKKLDKPQRTLNKKDSKTKRILKERKFGKKKDKMSNQIFNCVVDYFT